jgi:hypothetical protein
MDTTNKFMASLHWGLKADDHEKKNSIIGAKCISWSIVPEVYFTQG